MTQNTITLINILYCSKQKTQIIHFLLIYSNTIYFYISASESGSEKWQTIQTTRPVHAFYLWTFWHEIFLPWEHWLWETPLPLLLCDSLENINELLYISLFPFDFSEQFYKFKKQIFSNSFNFIDKFLSIRVFLSNLMVSSQWLNGRYSCM